MNPSEPARIRSPRPCVYWSGSSAPIRADPIWSLVRHRDSLIQTASTHVLSMQKALNQMNPRIHHLISDISGLTGLRIVDAILNGERYPSSLAKLRDRRSKASEETIIKSLVGDYRRERLFTLRQSLGLGATTGSSSQNAILRLKSS